MNDSILKETASRIWDGPVDNGIEQETVTAEALAHALLRVVCDYPGHMGRLRAARLIGGYRIPFRSEEEEKSLQRYAIECDWKLQDLLGLVDATISGGLIKQTHGHRPVLVLSRAGFHALLALESAA